MLPHRLGRALVGLFAGGVVLHPDVGRDIPVHGVDRRADGGIVPVQGFHHRRQQFQGHQAAGEAVHDRAL